MGPGSVTGGQMELTVNACLRFSERPYRLDWNTVFSWWLGGTSRHGFGFRIVVSDVA